MILVRNFRLMSTGERYKADAKMLIHRQADMILNSIGMYNQRIALQSAYIEIYIC